MDNILLIIGVVGLSISGWVLRGYFLNTPPVPSQDDPPNEVADQTGESDQQPVNYVTSEEHQLVLARLAELEKGGYVPKVNETVNAFKSPDNPLLTDADGKEEPATEALSSDKWTEIFALQQAYKEEREKEREIDYEREQVLFDISQGFDGRLPGVDGGSALSEEEEIDQRLLDNNLESGEDLEMYQERMATFASLTKEMLVMRLETADTQLREQNERHQATLLNIIASLIERMPGDINLKNVAQSSFIAASTEISNEDGQLNRENFQQMFYKNFGH